MDLKFSHKFEMNEIVDKASNFLTAAYLGVLVSPMIDTNLVAHKIMVLIAIWVAQCQSHVGTEVFYKKLDVLNLKQIFQPWSPDLLTSEEQSKALESLMFLEQKHSGTVSGQLIEDRSKQNRLGWQLPRVMSDYPTVNLYYPILRG